MNDLTIQSPPADLIRLAIEKGAGLEQIGQLLTLQERWDKAQAKKAYDAAFAAFKAEAIRLVKNRTVDAGPLRGSKFASLDSIIDVVTPALSKHGLSTSWKLTKDEKDWLEVTCFLRHIDGHEEVAAMGGPPDEKGAKSPVQARASTKTFLERYTLKAVLGLAEANDDNDGRGSDEEEDDEEVIDAWREKSLEGTKALEAYYHANVPTEDFWKKHGPALRKAAKAADADLKVKS